MRKNFTVGFKAFIIVLLASIGFTSISFVMPDVRSQSGTAVLKVEPTITILGDPNGTDVIGENFTVAVRIENITNLYGFDVRISWSTDYLAYLSHMVKVPVETYPDGVLHSPVIQVKNEVNETAGTYWCAYASMAPAPSFNGSGTIFIITFRIINQPWDYEIAPEEYIDTLIHFEGYKFVDKTGTEIPVTSYDGVVRIYAKLFEYPPLPLLKITPETIRGQGVGNEFTVDVWLMGEGGTDLDPFWDPAGFDIVLNFNTTLLEAINVTIDPDGWFASFWPYTITVKAEINNTAGTVWVVFFGYGEWHTPVNGTGRLFTVTFREKSFSGMVSPSAPIWLYNPRWYTASYDIHSLQGLIDLTAPEATTWMTFWPYGNLMTLDIWEDQDADNKLSLGDKLYMTDWEGKQLPYEVFKIAGTLNITQLELNRTDTLDAYPTPGNLSLTGPNLGIFSIYVIMANGTERYLATNEYVEYVGEPVVNITVNLDSFIIENRTIGVDVYLDSWNGFKYTPGVAGVIFIEAQNETHTWNLTADVDYNAWPGEIWWYLASVPGLDRGDTLRIGYWAVSTIEVFYRTVEPDPLRYIEFIGTYDEFLASLTNPINTTYSEIYPTSWRSNYKVIDWFDLDASGDLTPGDQLILEYTDTGDRGIYQINDIATDLRIKQLGVICDEDPTHKFFAMEPDVKIAGYPHPEKPMCPWHNQDTAPFLPHKTEPATFEAFFKPPGAWIDVYTQYPAPFGGQGPDEPSDMFLPQQEVVLYAYVTYNFWPEQNKDVTFEIIDNYGTTWAVLMGRTDSNGIATVSFRMPWVCDDPERYIGEWTVIATVEVAEVVKTDTLTFKYDYLINIWKVVTDATSYAHEETITVTVEFGSYAMQDYYVLFTITAVDETGVPFGFTYYEITIGGAEYCTYKNYTFSVTIYIPKWARAGLATIYVVPLSDYPQNGGTSYGPVASVQVGIEAA